MKHMIKYIPGDDYVEGHFFGELNKDSVRDYATAILTCAKDNACKQILNDLRDAQVKLSITEIYNLPRVFADIASDLDLNILKFNRAFIAPVGSEALEFFRTVSANQWHRTKYHQNYEEARAALLHGENS